MTATVLMGSGACVVEGAPVEHPPRFGHVEGFVDGERTPAPPMPPVPLRARGRER